MATRFNRRQALVAAGALALPSVRAAEPKKANGHLKQSICRWCYSNIPLEKLAADAKALGYQSIELLKPDEVLKIKPLGMTCAVLMGGPSVTIPFGFNRPENHDKLIKEMTEAIDFAAAEHLPNVICFSGNRKGMPDDVGLKNCIAGVKRIVGHAEAKGVMVIMELLNSKLNHKDYMCDRTPWGVDLVKGVGSPKFKLLYDIYHMQIMEGDVIATIKKHHDAIGHYHTGGVPGRAKIDDTQELNYGAICRAILKTGYDGYFGQEFIPRGEAMASLAQAFKICDVA